MKRKYDNFLTSRCLVRMDVKDRKHPICQGLQKSFKRRAGWSKRVKRTFTEEALGKEHFNRNWSDDPRDKWKHFKRWWGKEGEEDGSEKAMERMGIWGMTVSHETLLMNKDKGHDEIFATGHKAESDREGGWGSSEAESLELLVNSYWKKCTLKKGNLSQIWAHSRFL